jgi:hypothetical protein
MWLLREGWVVPGERVAAVVEDTMTLKAAFSRLVPEGLAATAGKLVIRPLRIRPFHHRQVEWAVAVAPEERGLTASKLRVVQLGVPGAPARLPFLGQRRPHA